MAGIKSHHQKRKVVGAMGINGAFMVTQLNHSVQCFDFGCLACCAGNKHWSKSTAKLFPSANQRNNGNLFAHRWFVLKWIDKNFFFFFNCLPPPNRRLLFISPILMLYWFNYKFDMATLCKVTWNKSNASHPTGAICNWFVVLFHKHNIELCLTMSCKSRNWFAILSK